MIFFNLLQARSHCIVDPLLKYSLTHIFLASFYGTWANSTDPDQMLQNMASDQGLHCLLTEFSIKI